METDRERYFAEIVFQHDNAPGYWSALLALNPGHNMHAMILINLAVRIGQIVAAHYKWHFKRTRPSYVCPGLLPPFGPPSHASFPSGHSMQSWLLTLLLTEVAPSFKDQLEWLAKRVALNRERAGVHYRSDTDAGEFIAGECVKSIKDEVKCPKISGLIKAANAEYPKAPAPTQPGSDAQTEPVA